ncbi:MAG: GDP-mannose 4,6-dehydratase [Candidatus Hydrogenedentes bacterium]|nr:GDP-mannose 4,6-dehydratase [Candidatus Hydrogenedentota bacterium]
MKKILVTGAAGFIGSHTCDALLARGDRVVGVDNFDSFYDPAIKRRNLAGALANERFSLHELDITDEQSLLRVFEAIRPDVAVHLAARAGVRPSLEDPNLYHRVNIIGSQHILDACRRFPVSHLVFASSSSVYGGIKETPFRETMTCDRPVSPYAATKRMNELMAHVYHHVYGLKVTLLRFFTVYGPRQRPEMAIHKFSRIIEEGGSVPMFGDGSSRRDYTFIEDILDGILKSIDTPLDYEIFNLGESHTTSLRELIDLLSETLGKPVSIEPLPFPPSDMETTFADISKAREMLGYNPRTSMREGLARFVTWYRAHSSRNL